MRPLFVASARFACALLASSLLAQSDPRSRLEELTRPVAGRARRASSGLFDPESNADCYHVQPGQRMVLAGLEGPGEVRHLWFTMMSHDRRYPRNMVLRIYWDHAEIPSVESPIGDFFAAGNGMRANVTSLPIEVTSYGRAMNCYWRMPFREHARIEIHNEGPSRTTVYFQCDWRELDSLVEDTLYFHARYAQEYPPTPFTAYTVFNARGRGQYVGTVLSSQNTMGSWFGESDDRFTIDGEVEPSIVGTGLEDYFNDGWNLRLFSTLRRGVTICETKGEERRISAFRWHLDDPIPFETSLKFEIERRSYLWVWDHEHDRTWRDPQGRGSDGSLFDFKYRPDWFSSVAFWYHDGVAPRFWEFPPGEQRLLEEVFIHPQEPATLASVRVSEGSRATSYANRVCNLKRGFRLRAATNDAWVEFPVRLTKRGRYAISIWQCLFTSGAVWKVSLRGQDVDRVLIPALDFHDVLAARAENWPENRHHGTIHIEKAGVHVLDAGEYTLRFERVGSSPVARHPETGAFGEGTDLLLDLIAFRKLPITDPVQWMEDYLDQEEELFAGRRDEARQTVDTLARAVQEYHAQYARWPERLEDALHDDVPLDPWGQRYLYRAPGRFHPDAFDLWSRHGNVRDPAGWIGNWPWPYRLPGAIEGEDLTLERSSKDVRASPQRLTLSVDSSPLSNGALLFVRLHAPGDEAEFLLPDTLNPGRYRVTLFGVRARDYAQVQWSLDGTPLGSVWDGYSPAIDRHALPSTEVEITTRPRLQLEVVGKNPLSTGFYAGLDAIRLEPL